MTAFLFKEKNNIMYAIHPQLFEAQDIRFGPIDHEAHPHIEARWTHDAEFMDFMELGSAQPLSPAMVRVQYESIEKEMSTQKDLFYFTIRAKDDDRLIGKAILEYVNWTNGNAYLRLGIGEAEFRHKGYGSQALHLLLQYAFAELNLFRVTAVIPAYNEDALRLLQKFNFMEEVRRPNAMHYNGKFWDLVCYGLLKTEWLESTSI